MSGAGRAQRQLFETFRNTWVERIDERLRGWLDELAARPGCPPRLAAAMRYALLSPGKRLRPLLCLAAARCAGGREQLGLDVAAAVELVHAYSLIHDDLPAMDDDDLRRGRPTCHRRFGEALAILAGDALLTHAFELLVAGLEPERAGAGVVLLARAAGAAGMVGGQVDDVEPDDGRSAPDVERVESIHRRKTARLIQAAVGLGGLVAGADRAGQQALEAYGDALGLAFQVADDLLAATGDAAALGRPTGGDAAHDRRTYPRAVGVAAARERAGALADQAVAALAPFGRGGDVLVGLVGLVSDRAGA